MPPIGRRFKKGEVNNPRGRPADYGKFRALCREKTPEAIAALMLGLDEEKNRVAAARVLLEYGYGKPVQGVELSGADGENLRVIIQKLPQEG